MEYIEQYLWPYIGSQIAAIVILLISLKSPKIARWLFALLFGGACYINMSTAFKTPEVYLDYAPMSLPLYAHFINGWFKDHITLMVSVIAMGQGMIAVGMLLNGIWVKLASTGAVLFLLAIVPLGVGSGFPFPLLVALAALLMVNKDNLDYSWRFNRKPSIYEN